MGFLVVASLGHESETLVAVKDYEDPGRSINIPKNKCSRMETSIALTFTEKEIEYIKSQRLARIATASKKGDPDVAL